MNTGTFRCSYAVDIRTDTVWARADCDAPGGVRISVEDTFDFRQGTSTRVKQQLGNRLRDEVKRRGWLLRNVSSPHIPPGMNDSMDVVSFRKIRRLK